MKFLDEFRDSEIAKYLLSEIKKTSIHNWVIMELCGGQTHTIIQNGIDQLLPNNIEIVHGPGCPVCVTPVEMIDQAIIIAGRQDVIFTSFGDMLRVPGSNSDLLKIKSEGADVRIVYSPLEALKIAKENPQKEVVFFAIGFETTAPGNAMAIVQADNHSVTNFSELVSQALVPPAIELILSSSSNRINGFLAAGHVCTIMGCEEYEFISKEYKVPIVPTGFEPVDMLAGILKLIELLENDNNIVHNKYERVIRKEGNTEAQLMINKIFEIVDRKWRGIGEIERSGLGIRERYEKYDASKKFGVSSITPNESELCISGKILQGLNKPYDCSQFGNNCTPITPLGATMVSSEGACAAYYKFKRYKNVTIR